MLTNLESQTSCKFHFNVDPLQWATAMMWAWMDQLRDVETLPVIGESLVPGDVVMDSTRTLYKLIEPLETRDYFGRTMTQWRTVPINVPTPQERTQAYYSQHAYRVLPKGA